jgi:hypothetical protein
MSTPPIRLFRSTDTGAPTLSGTAGALIDLLDACLKDGYNSKSVQSITRSGSTATVTFATAHGFAADGLTIVRIAGAGQSEYNGDFQISNVTSTAFDITVAGTPATPATGTITAKVAPADWTKPFSGTNKAVYRAPSGNRLFLRIDDANPNADSNKSASTRGYETMTDVDTGSGPFPTVAQLSTGILINKSSSADSTARNWLLFGDGYEFYFFYAPHSGASNVYRQFHFGDPAPEMDSDPYGTLIYGDYALNSTSNQVPTGQATYQISNLSSALSNNNLSGHYFARAYTQTGASVAAGRYGNWNLGGQYIGGDGAQITYPAPHNTGLYIAPLFISDGSVPRAQAKATWQPLHVRPLGHSSVVPADKSPIGRRLYAVATAGTLATPGETHIDIDGPWR